MQQDAQVYAERFDVVAELAARAFGKAFSGFDLDYYPSLDQHIDAVEPDLSALEAHGHGVFAIHSQPALLHRNLKCAGIEQLHEPVPKLIVNIEKTANNNMAKLFLDDDRVRGALPRVGVIRVHSCNSHPAVRGRTTQILPSMAYLLRSVLIGVSIAACTTAPGGSGTPEWTLAWSDEFTGAAGAAVDTTRWVADTGGQGWGNQERQYYTPGPENASLDGGGNLVITARTSTDSSRRCWYGVCGYTSARLKTKGRFETAYGRFEARLRVPRGQGIWPAFWMLGANIDQVGWPQSGEIDVMENIGREPNIVHGTVHGPGYSGANGIGGAYTLTTAEFADDFHVFTVEWTPGQIRWLIDGTEYRRLTPAGIPSGATWVFDHPFFMLLNVAVGGAWPGDPDATTPLPQQMVVDYVRVYRR